MRIGLLLGALLLVQSGTAAAADKMSPAFLRERHAGAQVFVSPDAVKTVYPKLLQAAQECRAGKFVGAPGSGAGGAAGTISSASNQVVGELADDGESATIFVRRIGLFGATKANFFQIDLRRDGAGARIEAFHRMRYDRDFLVEVAHWVDGDLGYCESNPYSNPKSGEA